MDRRVEVGVLLALGRQLEPEGRFLFLGKGQHGAATQSLANGALAR